jgi:Z1 domain
MVVAHMNPQVEKFVKSIREKMQNYDSPEATAMALRKEFEELGFSLDASMIANLEEAAKFVRASMRDVVILRRNSIIAEREEWYTGPSPRDRHWPALLNYFENTKKWDTDTINPLNESSSEVVSLLDNPSRRQFACRGLVVGYVQSGKTANMTAVMAKAVDSGYNLIIVLGGVTNKLRAQTQRRFFKDVVSRHRHLWQIYTTDEDTGDFSHPANGAFAMPHEGAAQLIVMKKEGSRLRALGKTISKTLPVVLEKLKVLLIDDECDQASVNSARGEYDMTKINEEIRKVLAALPAVSYVGYTATPFANVFIDPFPFNQDKLDDLYPSDFITALPRPKGYFGTLEVFGRASDDPEDAERDMVRTLAEDEPGLLRPTNAKDKAGFAPRMTEGLQDAVLWFLASCAIRRLRGHGDSHMTMLIHSSQYVAQHRAMVALVETWLADNGPDLIAGTGKVSGRFDSVVEDERRRTINDGQSGFPEPLQDIRATLAEVLNLIEYAVENGESDMRLDYENGPKTYIAVGGTVLARGLTLEGLSVSFFLRTSKQYDTLLQMGRWFGFRPGYEDLPRLWTTTDLAAKFRSLAVIEDEIRTDIASYKERKLTPMDFAVRVRQIPGMAITAATKMKHAHRTSMTFDGQHVQTIRFDHRNPDFVRGNWAAASDLIDAALAASTRENQERRILFRGVPVEAIRKFLVSTTISPHHMDLKTEHLLDYLDQVGASLGPWNVGVILPKSDTVSTRDLGGLGKVSTMQRTQLKSSPASYADIKALMSKRDILIDVPQPPSKPQGRSETWTDLKSVRPSTPLLLIYPIDAASQGEPERTSRKALGAVGDLIGFGMVFPGSKDRSGNWFSVELDAPAREQIEEDELAEIEDVADEAANA